MLKITPDGAVSGTPRHVAADQLVCITNLQVELGLLYLDLLVALPLPIGNL